MTGLGIERQIEIAQQYGGLTSAELQRVQAGDERVLQLVHARLFAALHDREVKQQDIPDVSKMIPAR